MSPSGDTQGSLLNRSPRSRKSLAVVGAGQSLPTTAPAKRKRAHSMAPGENFKMDDARRRSLMRPAKGILKPSNQIDPAQVQAQDTTEEMSQTTPSFPKPFIPDDTDTTETVVRPPGDFLTNVHDNLSRKSLGGRRVSFAAHAHVRVFDSADQNNNGTSSPSSSPAHDPSNPVSSPSLVQPSQEAQPSASSLNDLEPSQSPSRRASIGRRRRSTIHRLQDEEGEGEESMDVSNDDIPLHTTVPTLNLGSFRPQTPNIDTAILSGGVHDDKPVNDDDDSFDGDDDEGDMSMTGEFGPGIVSRRRTLSIAGRDRRKSRMRSSITAPPEEGGVEPKDFTVSLDRPPPPESDAFKALKAIANGNRADSVDAASEDGEVDMDVTTAVTRLIAVRDSMGGQVEAHNMDDSFTSTEDSFDGVDTGDRTVNVTNLMGSFRASDYGVDDDVDVTMSATSVVGGSISTRSVLAPELASSAHVLPSSQPAPFVLAPSPPLPVLNESSASTTQALFSKLHRISPSVKTTASRPTSPVRHPIKKFTAAFAPPHQSPKRPIATLDNDIQGMSMTSPNKRRAVAANESSTRRVSIPVAQAHADKVSSNPISSTKGLSNKARRPSGYYRKSLVGGGAPSDANVIITQLSSTSGHHRRQSMAPKTCATSPKKLATVSKSLAVAPKNSTNLQHNETEQCTVEDRRQSSAQPSPTRGSPSPCSPTSKARYNPEKQISNQISPPNEVNEEDVDNTKETPTFSTTPAQSIDPGQWATTVDGDEVPRDDDLAPISIDQFFSMTGIRFMDDLTCPRRSTIHPSQLQRRESNDGEDDIFLLSDYAVAINVEIAQLETMTWIANDIRSAIEKYKTQYRQTEEDATKDIPSLFREFATASEEDREQILYVLKLIKAHTILSAKASWYEWKRGWVQGLQTNAEHALDNLDADERQLAGITASAGQALPSLRSEYEAIMRELEQEKAAVAEIENCDKTFLSELKGTIAEQRQELDVYRNDIADGNAKLARLEETLEELEDQAREAKTAISTAQRHMDMQKSTTRAEVFRLRDELSSLQGLHLWRATQLAADKIEFVYDSKYKVTIPCRRFSPIPDALDVLPFGQLPYSNDDFPLVTEIMYRIARRHAIQDHDNKLTLRMIIQRLTDFWASYAQLRWQLSFIIIKYPLSIQLLPTGSGVDDAEGFKATATLLLCRKTSKAHISFHFGSEILCTWPTTMKSLNYDVSVVYGKADSNMVGEAIKTRLLEASVVENHACLVDACMEVVSRYS